MKTRGLLLIGLVSLVVSNVCVAKTTDKTGEIYKNRCANCHGAKANGVPKLKEQAGMSAEEAAAAGTSSQEKGNIYGPPLNTFGKEELLSKLQNLRNKDFDAKSYHSVMRENLKHIEERDGKVSDAKMAEYIYNAFGGGAK